MAAAVLCHMTKNVPVCEELVRFGAVRVLINHLSSHHPELQSRCTVILTDLAAHSGTYQTQIAELVSLHGYSNTIKQYSWKNSINMFYNKHHINNI